MVPDEAGCPFEDAVSDGVGVERIFPINSPFIDHVELVSQDDSQLTYKIKDENGNEYTYQENSNSVEIQADGDVADGEVEVEVSGNASDLPAADTAE